MVGRAAISIALLFLSAAVARGQDAAPVQSGTTTEAASRDALLRLARGSITEAEATAELEALVARDPGSKEARLALADLLARTTEVVAEVHSLDGRGLAAGAVHARERLPEAVLVLERLHRDDPGDDAITVRLAVALVESGEDTARARSLLEGIGPGSNFRAVALYEVGVVHLRAGETRDAARALEESVTREPARPEPRYALGLARRDLGDTAGALSSLEVAAVGSGSIAGLSWHAIGGIHERALDLEAASRDYARAGAASPSLAAASHVDRGRVFLRLGQARPAADAFKAAQSLGVNDSRVSFHLGLALFLARDAAGLAPVLEDLERKDPVLGERLAAIAGIKPGSPLESR